jgi:enoyl-CoA hydratase/carnithine racemase
MSETLPSPTRKLAISIEDAVATVAIDNPEKRNALDLEMWSAFPPIMTMLAKDDRVRTVVLRGAGDGAFASGADITEFETVRADAAGGRRYEAENEAAFWAVARCPKPVLAMIRGFCLGGGFGRAVSCDLRIAADGAAFGIPAARLGVGYPPGAISLVVAAVGSAAAKDLFFTARRIDASEARRLGVLQRVVSNADLESTTLSLAHAIAANAPLTIRAAKAAIDDCTAVGSPLGRHAAALADACFDSADYKEGIRAFLDKREPRFQGR